jgi:hypothetical protein
MLELLTCPFCGGDPEMIWRSGLKEYFVKCTNDDCRSNAGIALDITKAHKTQDSAAKHWNTTVNRVPIKKFNVRKV